MHEMNQPAHPRVAGMARRTIVAGAGLGILGTAATAFHTEAAYADTASDGLLGTWMVTTTYTSGSPDGRSTHRMLISFGAGGLVVANAQLNPRGINLGTWTMTSQTDFVFSQILPLFTNADLGANPPVFANYLGVVVETVTGTLTGRDQQGRPTLAGQAKGIFYDPCDNPLGPPAIETVTGFRLPVDAVNKYVPSGDC